MTNGQESEERNGDFEIYKLPHNPGVYYERVRTLRASHATWKLVTNLGIQDFLNQKPNVPLQMEYLRNLCTKFQITSCPDTKLEPMLIGKLNDTRKYEEILRRTPKDDEYLLPRQKRGALFGFVGRVSKGLFGTLNEEDAAYYDGEIDKLHADQRHMAEIVENQTHILRSEFSDIHQNLASINNRTTLLTRQANILGQNIKSQQNHLQRLQYEELTEQCLNELMRYVEDYRMSIIILATAVMFARQGNLHPAILSPEQLVNAARQIQQRTNYDFPLTEEELHSETLNEVSELQLSHYKGNLILQINIPLLDKRPYNVYQLHPCPTKQLITPNHTLAVFIKPRNPYLAVTTDGQWYITPTEKYLQQCKIHHRQYICQSTLPIYNVKKRPTCETMLLTDPTKLAWDTCDLRALATEDGYWTRLESTNSWLFSIMNPIEIKILCKRHVAGKEILTGAGTLQIRAGCSASTGTTKLIAQETLTTKEMYSYTPVTSLNLTLVAPELQQQELAPMMNILIPPSMNEHNAWEHSENAMTLKELEHQARDLQMHQRGARHNLIVYGGMSCTSVVLILVLAYLGYRWCRQPSTPRIRSSPWSNRLGSSARPEIIHPTPRIELYEEPRVSPPIRLEPPRAIMASPPSVGTPSIDSFTVV